MTTVVGLLAFKGIVILDSDPNARTHVSGSTNRPLEAYPELGISVVTSASSGASTVVLGKPRLMTGTYEATGRSWP